MERKNDSTILLLVAAGLGIYWFMKNKSLPPATTSVVVPTTTPISEAVVSTQPVYTPADIISTQPVYTPADIISTQPVYEQPVQDVVNIEYTPVMDMFNSISSGGGLTNNQIETINNIPQSALSDKYL
jgi:hypothetical protein